MVAETSNHSPSPEESRLPGQLQEPQAQPAGTPTGRANPSRFAIRLLVVLTLLIVGGFVLAIQFPGFFSGKAPEKQSVSDPRRSYAGPFANVHPEVRYVGMEACANCHEDIAQTYVKTPMARALIPVVQLAEAQVYAKANNNPFVAGDSAFDVERRGKRVFHRELCRGKGQLPEFQMEVEAQFAIGSGNHGHSYASFLGDGYLFQTSISWFSQKKIWDISPGFGPNQKLRPISGECLFCHANQSFPKKDTFNQFEAPFLSGHAIGCERCHGPGEKHVRQQQFERVREEWRPHLRERVSKVDVSIVNPGKLRADLREAVCQQCHLEGEARVLPVGRNLYDFRPGMPLEDFISTFVQPRESGEDKKAVNHVEQMYLSRCFERSQGDAKLGCITCHNPHEHVSAEQSVTHFRDRCLRCHTLEERREGRLPCSLSLANRRAKNQDNCFACHMPRYSTSDIAHAASTDHRIVRTPSPPVAGNHSAGKGSMPLAHFHRGKVDFADKSMNRDFGVALLRAMAHGKADPRLMPNAIELLERALVDFPEDTVTWESKAFGLFVNKRFAEAQAAAETVLGKRPNREESLKMAAMAAQNLGRIETAIDYWRKTIAVNPWIAAYRANLVPMLADRGEWREALPHIHQWLKLHPASTQARELWREALKRTGFRGDPAAEFERLESATDAPAMRDMLKSKLRIGP